MTGIRLGNPADKALSMENVTKSPQRVNYFYSGIGVFQEDRLVGWLNQLESRVYNYITNHVTSSIAEFECPNSKGKFTIDVVDAKAKLRPRIANGEPKITLEQSILANVEEVACDIDLKEEADVLQLQEAANTRQEEIFMDGIRKVQSYGADIFGFGEAFHRAYPRQWHAWEPQWDERFRNIEVSVHMNIQLQRIGKIISPFETHSEHRGVEQH
jgi:spore germination protein KC